MLTTPFQIGSPQPNGKRGCWVMQFDDVIIAMPAADGLEAVDPQLPEQCAVEGLI